MPALPPPSPHSKAVLLQSGGPGVGVSGDAVTDEQFSKMMESGAFHLGHGSTSASASSAQSPQSNLGATLHSTETDSIKISDPIDLSSVISGLGAQTAQGKPNEASQGNSTEAIEKVIFDNTKPSVQQPEDENVGVAEEIPRSAVHPPMLVDTDDVYANMSEEEMLLLAIQKSQVETYMR